MLGRFLLSSPLLDDPIRERNRPMWNVQEICLRPIALGELDLLQYRSQQEPSERTENMGLEIACIQPASGGFGLWQLQEWQSEGDYDISDFATDGQCDIADSPGEAYTGLIQGESEADGWLIPWSNEDDLRPMAYRIS